MAYPRGLLRADTCCGMKRGIVFLLSPRPGAQGHIGVQAISLTYKIEGFFKRVDSSGSSAICRRSLGYVGAGLAEHGNDVEGI